jgi:hypothetical protein
MGLELRNRLECELQLSLPSTLVWIHPTLRELADHLAGKLVADSAGGEPEAREPATHAAAPRLNDVGSVGALLRLVEGLGEGGVDALLDGGV